MINSSSPLCGDVCESEFGYVFHKVSSYWFNVTCECPMIIDGAFN